MNPNISKLEKKLNIKIKNKTLLVEALTHKSTNKITNNEKLEFLGDRVLALIISQKLFDLYPKETEGVLDKRFAKLVNKKTCAFISWENKFKDYIIMGDKKKIITKKDEKILSDTCEAIIGAIFIDRGFHYVQDFVLKIWRKEITESNVTVLDPKTKLQEYSLKFYKKLPKYKVLSSKGPRHNPTFEVSVSIYKTKEYMGSGNSKKEAEQNAANNLLKKLKID